MRPPDAQDELDALLGQWSAATRLSAAEAEDVREAVLATPRVGLDASWWRELVAQVSDAVTTATAPPAGLRSALTPTLPVGAWGAS